MTSLAEFRLDPALKAEVLKLLRDPNTVQGHGMLRNNEGGVCCLELFCQVAIRHGINPPPSLRTEDETPNSYSEWFYGNPGERSDAYLPASVKSFFRFTELGELFNGDPIIPVTTALGYKSSFGKTLDVSLASLNDHYGFTLPQIADMIDYFL